MNASIENFVDIEEMPRRCVAHDEWMRAHPNAAAFSETWGIAISPS
jgi:hypothetical protein